MELMQNVAKMQSSQFSNTVEKGEAAKISVQPTQLQKTAEAVQESVQKEAVAKVRSSDDMQELVKQLNHALDPFRTSLRFGYDDTFYVSVIETKTNKMIRRFPAEEAGGILTKIQDLNGFLFDEKG